MRMRKKNLVIDIFKTNQELNKFQEPHLREIRIRQIKQQKFTFEQQIFLQKRTMKNPKYHLDNLYPSSREKDHDTTRKIYLGAGLLSKTQRNQQPKSPNPILKELNFKAGLSKLRTNLSHDTLAYSERKNASRQPGLKRQSSLKERNFKQKSLIHRTPTKYHQSARLNSSNSRFSKLEKADKSTMISELENAANRLQKLKQEKKLHEMGKNCRVVVIQGTNEEQHFVEVDKIDDIMTYLRKQYPRYRYYKSIPCQLTIDYFVMEGGIDGKFLNGQSLYLKPCGRLANSVDEKEQVGLDSFQILKLIGSGGFSKVFLCRFKEDGRFYAMKVIDKEVIVKNKKKRIIMNERNIMRQSNHPFVIDMKFAFESEKYLVFVMQYCAGGELFGLIKKYRRIDEDMARFYIIEIFLGLSYLHSQKVVYRDIKPENILLRQNGHIKIADLGLAKPDMYEGQMAYSFCGSPEYMSPEMILQVGHTFPVDYYCMGALLYELLTGLPPYYSRDPNEIYEAVLSQQLTFPGDVGLSSQCRSLLRGLLCKQPKQRLGSIHGVKQILAHPWFGKNQYSRFLQLQAQPPTNFSSIAKINLDDYTNEEKSKQQVEEVKKQQKIERKKFKQAMKGFYYDFRVRTLSANQQFRQSAQKLQDKTTRDLNFRKKSASKKRYTQTTNRDNKNENPTVQKQTFINFQHLDNNHQKLQNQRSTLKKITNRGSRNNLLKRKNSGQGSSKLLVSNNL